MMFDNKVLTIIQARMQSTRLAGKVMLDISGKPMLWHVIDRVKRAKNVDSIVVATTSDSNQQIFDLTCKAQVNCYAGNENDVLDRYYQAAVKFKGEIIVRITADCPLIDPNVIDRAIDYFNDGQFDYVTNQIEPTYPDGLDTEVFSMETLEKTWKQANLPSDREHVTTYIRSNPDLFKVGNYKFRNDFSEMRWTIDHQSDLDFVRSVYAKLYKAGEVFLLDDVLQLLDNHPEIIELNRGFVRDEGYLKSLEQESL